MKAKSQTVTSCNNLGGPTVKNLQPLLVKKSLCETDQAKEKQKDLFDPHFSLFSSNTSPHVLLSSRVELLHPRTDGPSFKGKGF